MVSGKYPTIDWSKIMAAEPRLLEIDAMLQGNPEAEAHFRFRAMVLERNLDPELRAAAEALLEKDFHVSPKECLAWMAADSEKARLT